MPEHLRSRRRAAAFTLVELLVVIAIIGVLVALLLPAIQAARESARRMSCQNNVKNMSLGCLNYENARGVYPPGAVNTNKVGINGSSWQLVILPYLEQGAMSGNVAQIMERLKKANGGDDVDYYSIKAAANSGDQTARQLIEALKAVTIYSCPTDDPGEAIDKFEPDMRASNYAGVMGSFKSRKGGTCPGAYNDVNYLAVDCVGPDGTLADGMNIDGILFAGSKVKAKDITDGSSNTLMIGERWYQLRAWPLGNYYSTEYKPKTPPPGPPVASAVSSCKNVDSRYPPNCDLNAVGYYQNHDNTNDRPRRGPATVANVKFNNLQFQSFHSAGVNFGRADGGVTMLNDGIDPLVWVALGSRNGDEVVSLP